MQETTLMHDLTIQLLRTFGSFMLLLQYILTIFQSEVPYFCIAIIVILSVVNLYFVLTFLEASKIRGIPSFNLISPIDTAEVTVSA